MSSEIWYGAQFFGNKFMSITRNIPSVTECNDALKFVNINKLRKNVDITIPVEKLRATQEVDRKHLFDDFHNTICYQTSFLTKVTDKYLL